MADVDTFLTILYVMVDDFCKHQSQPGRTPGPKAAVTRSEVVTLIIFSQWARFRSERDFYRYAAYGQLFALCPAGVSSTDWRAATTGLWPLSSTTPSSRGRLWTVPVFPPGSQTPGRRLAARSG